VGTVRRNTVTAAVREQEPPVGFPIAITRAYLRYWLVLGTRRASAGYRSDVCFETLSRAGDTATGARAKKQENRTMTVPARRQPSLLLPVSGGRRRKEQLAAEPTSIATKRGKKA
jgi:hypothetical protein